MDIDAARSVQRDLVKLHGSILRIVQSTNGKISGLPPHWRSNSADRFFEQYYRSMGEVSGILGKLEEITSEIESAINEYERIAAKLSD